MVMDKSHKPSNSGQAMMEMALSMVIFIILISAAASYYKVMRTAILRQEVSRNLIFAKINNAGSLTSIPRDSLNGRLYLGGLGSSYTVQASGQSIIDPNSSCITVIPGGDASVKVGVPFETKSSKDSGGSVSKAEVNILTYSVIYRRSGARCVD